MFSAVGSAQGGRAPILAAIARVPHQADAARCKIDPPRCAGPAGTAHQRACRALPGQADAPPPAAGQAA